MVEIEAEVEMVVAEVVAAGEVVAVVARWVVSAEREAEVRPQVCPGLARLLGPRWQCAEGVGLACVRLHLIDYRTSSSCVSCGRRAGSWQKMAVRVQRVLRR